MQFISRVFNFILDALKEYLPFFYFLTTTGKAENLLSDTAEYIERYLESLLPAADVDVTLGGDSSIVFTVKISDDRKVQFVLATTRNAPVSGVAGRVVASQVPVIYTVDLVNFVKGDVVPTAVVEAAVNSILSK
jgi:hypothetical protein